MISLEISREEQTPEGTISLDAVIGRTHDGEPILVRHLLAELDIAAVTIAGFINDARVLENGDPIPPEQVRADLVTMRIQHDADSARWRGAGTTALHDSRGGIVTRTLTYLACAYSSDDPFVRAARFKAANIAAGQLMTQGHIIFSPISMCHPLAEECELPKDWQFWSALDHAYLAASKLLVVLCIDGWKESVGVTAEIAIAESMGIPIEYMEPSLPTERQACGIHIGVASHICGKLCPSCEPCATRSRLRIDERGNLVEVHS